MLSRLKFTIQEKFGSQREFAQKIELHETSLSNIINEALEPSEEQKEKISAGLKENWDDLIKPIL
jgi:transcriptional regulator with XRE-family HTH domain